MTHRSRRKYSGHQGYIPVDLSLAYVNGGAPGLCFVVDVNVAWLKVPLRKRGFVVYAPHENYSPALPDPELWRLARKLGCVLVSRDKYFKDREGCIWIPREWEIRYNSWELVTKIVKLAALLIRSRE